jgi:hypothetical protein
MNIKILESFVNVPIVSSLFFGGFQWRVFHKCLNFTLSLPSPPECNENVVKAEQAKKKFF